MLMRRIGLGCIGLAIACAIAERLFFSGIHDNGVLRESFFLPLAWGFAVVGGVLLVSAGAARIRRELKGNPKTR